MLCQLANQHRWSAQRGSGGAGADPAPLWFRPRAYAKRKRSDLSELPGEDTSPPSPLPDGLPAVRPPVGRPAALAEHEPTVWAIGPTADPGPAVLGELSGRGRGWAGPGWRGLARRPSGLRTVQAGPPGWAP